MNWKILLLPIAIVVELANLPLVVIGITHGETGFGNWVADRELGDPEGKFWQTREQAIAESNQKHKI